MTISDKSLVRDLKFNTVYLIREILEGSVDSADLNPIVKNVSAKGNFDDYVSKSENKGESFTTGETDVLSRLDTKPYKTMPDEIRFSSTEITNNNNKELAVVKKGGRYVAFFSVRKPTDVTADTDLTSPDKGSENKQDEIIIKISRPFSDPKINQDPSLLYDLINTLTKEYQI